MPESPTTSFTPTTAPAAGQGRPRTRRKLRRRLRLTAVIALAVIVLAVGTVKILYGLGTSYAGVGGAPAVVDTDVTAVATLQFPPGNVTGTPGGRIFFNTHPVARADRFTGTFLYELVDGTPRPYPDQASQSDLKSFFGLTVDRQNRLWLTAPANFDRDRTRLIAYDLTTNTKIIDHELPPGVARFGQDLRVTPDGRSVLLANPGAFRITRSDLVVVDVATWQAREVLTDSPATQAGNWLIHTTTGEPYRLGYGLLTFQVGIDGIDISPDGHWLNIAPMSSDTLYRVPLADILDPALSAADLAGRVQPAGNKPLSDGISTAADGSVLVTDVEHGGIDRVDARGTATTLVRLRQVRWADGVYAAPDGDVYLTDSALPAYIDQLMRPPSLDRLRAGRPYHVYRFHLPG